jgi:hypothetical protein
MSLAIPFNQRQVIDACSSVRPILLFFLDEKIRFLWEVRWSRRRLLKQHVSVYLYRKSNIWCSSHFVADTAELLSMFCRWVLRFGHDAINLQRTRKRNRLLCIRYIIKSRLSFSRTTWKVGLTGGNNQSKSSLSRLTIERTLLAGFQCFSATISECDADLYFKGLKWCPFTMMGFRLILLILAE